MVTAKEAYDDVNLNMMRKLWRTPGMRWAKHARLLLGACVLAVVLLVWGGDIARFLGIRSASAAAYQMQTGYYIGNGGSKEISGLGFTPEVVILKAHDAGGTGAIMKTTAMPELNVAYLSGATADNAAGAIILTRDGFRVSGALSDTANSRYTWIAFAGSDCSASGQMCVGAYLGNGTSPRALPLTGFSPDLVLVKAATAVAPNWRSLSMPNNYGQYLAATAQDTAGALFTTLDATGFTVGATNNTNAVNYYFVAFQETPSVIDVGTYTGSGTDNNDIGGVGFVPDFVFTKQTGAVAALYNVTESYGDSSSYFTDTANLVNGIQALQTDGFQVGTNATANTAATTYYYAAFGGASDTRTTSGTFTMASGSYVGTGGATAIGNVGFEPDLVIIKASTTQAGVFRTTMMPSDSTAYLDSATANFAGGITAMNPDGFTVGTAAQVNSAGVTYYWTAYGNAWRPDRNDGAGDFFIGAYNGNAIDNRDITRLPFQPDLVTIKRSGASTGAWRTSEHTGDTSAFFSATAETTNTIQALNPDGFEIGTSANVNTNANLNWYFGFATGTNFSVGTYSGTGVAQTIATPFQPDLVWAKQTGATRGVLRTSTMLSSSSAPFINVAPIVNAITGIVPSGFEVGTAAEVNTSGANNYRYAVWNDTHTVGTSTYEMQTGFFIGNGGSKEISGLGFTPEVVILKAHDAGGTGAIMKTTAMPELNVAYLSGATADNAAGAIILTRDGFRVSGALSDTANSRYTWIAFAGSDCSASGQMCVGAYLGNGTSPRALPLTGFSPDLVLVKAATAVAPNWRSLSMPNNYGQYLAATAQDTAGALFTTLDATGFTVGATNNTNAVNYYFVAFQETPSVIDVGTYTGSGTDNNDIGGVGFVPDFVFTKQTGAVAALYNVTESYGDSSSYFTDTANLVNGIQALQTDGFQVGTNATANTAATTYYYAAFGGASDTRTTSGTFTMASGSYVGTGGATAIGNVGFEPDLVIIKASTTQAGVFRTTMMPSDSTAYLDSATANFAGGITAMNPDGFTVGTAAQVNSAGVTYYWTAYGNAWRPDRNDGAGDFFIGAYNGNAIDNRDITRLPFQPDLVTIKRSGASTGAWRTSEHTGDTSAFFSATAETTNTIQALNPDGFEIGTSANVNTNANLNWYFGFATGTNFSVGTYSGTGVAQTIATPFQPDLVWAKQTGATRGVLRTSTMLSSSSAPFINVAPIVNAITGIVPSGFEVGTAAEVNTSGANNYRYAVWRSPVFVQAHYHFRADDGNEATALSLTGGMEDTPYTNAREGVPLRIRTEVVNQSGASASASFRLEYAERGVSCADATAWTRVGDAGGAFDMYDSANLTDGEDTTNIAVATGGVTDEDATFTTPNGGVRDMTDEAALIGVASDGFIELEYSVVPTQYATDTTPYCFRVTDAGAGLSIYDEYPETTFYAHLFATSTGTQTPYADVPSANVYTGGAFVVYDVYANDTHTITDVTLAERGTVDASSSLANIKLFYEYDTTTPYDCADESYDGTETQFGTTDTNGFSDADGTVSFSGSLTASSTQAICLYPMLDILESASTGETIEIEISTTTEDVLVSGGEKVHGVDPVRIASSTILRDDLLTQTHYHWRNDDGSEATASSVTGGVEDSAYVNMPRNTTKRLRVAVSNEGATSSLSTQYRLEYGEKVSTCDAIGTWTDVGTAGGAFDMYNTSNLTDGADTTDIPLGDGGTTNENVTFKTPNGGVKDTSSQTGGIILAETEFVELEYAVRALSGATDGTSYCFRVTDAGTSISAYNIYGETTMTAAVLVSALGTQTETAVSPGVDQYLGGAFLIEDQVSSRNVTSITLTENGSIDAASDLSNVRLHYEHSTTTPYDCSDVSYDGNEAQFGATAPSFSGANGSSTFNGSVTISTTSALCVYAVVDVDGTANGGDTIDIEIEHPGEQVQVSAGAVNPNTPVAIAGSTTVEKLTLSQDHYHWRNDDGSESGATSATGGVEDTPVSGLVQNGTIRLRVEASQSGTVSSPVSFGLEYAERVSTCEAVASWTPIESPNGTWALSDSPNLTNGSDTTNIAIGAGGVTDSKATFKTPNGAVRDTNATTSDITLSSTEFLELEYALEPTGNVAFGGTYCFRLTTNGAPLETYTVYPQATIRTNQDFYIQRGMSTINSGASTVGLVAGTDYVAPKASTSAFIRITNAMHTGAGANSGGGAQNASNVTVSVVNPSELLSGITLARAGTTNNTRVYWEIIEYIGPVGGDNEIKVRDQVALTYGTASLAATTSVVGGVADDSDVAVFITGQRNPAANSTNYPAGISTAAWNASDDTATFTRGTTGSVASVVSYAVVEFTGVNWKVQRSEHAHSSAGATETETITAVNDLSRAFLHTQKRTGANQVDEFGHEVWLSSVGQVSYYIPSTATSPNTHVHVAWVIENTQTNGTPMQVTRSNGSQASGGVEPSTYSIAIGTTLSALSNTTIHMNMIGLGNTTAHPRAIMGATIASTTHYELWISDTGSARSYRTEVVEWPTAELALEQNYYRWYTDNDALDPSDAWPQGAVDLGENTAITASDDPPTEGDVLRLRMSVRVHGSNISRETKRFTLEYGVRSTVCSAISTWYAVGDSASTTVWRGYNASPLSGTPLSGDPPSGGDLNLSVSDRAGTYEESGSTVLNPYKLRINDDVEYDWVLTPNGVADKTAYCFRMVNEDRSEFDTYTYYPTLTTAGFEVVQGNWWFFDDESELTPVAPLAATNTAPSGIGPGDVFKLRVTLSEVAGKAGTDVKFKLQYSTVPDFSVAYDVADQDTCVYGSRWCMADGAGTEGERVQATVMPGDACVLGVGDGCGTHNEYSYAPDVLGEVGTTTVDGTGTTISLQHTYDDPVFIVEAISGDSAGGSSNRPAVAIITATSTNSLSVRIARPDNEVGTHGPETVGYVVMERGAHTLPDGRRVDAGTIDTTHYYGSDVSGASDDTCTFTQTFSGVPIVLTSLQTDNNTGTPDFLTASQALVTVDDFACSMEVPDGETNEPTAPETYGWIAIERGVFKNNGTPIVATTTGVAVSGWANTPWYEELFPLEWFTRAPGLVASKQTRNGAEGGWVRYDDASMIGALFAIDERDDGERSHGDENVGYLAFGTSSGVLYRGGTSGISFPAGAVQEYEFTMTHKDAAVGQVYYFRLYDVRADAPVGTTTVPGSYPSIVSASGEVTFTVSGIPTGSSTEGVTMDITTTALSIPFGSLSLGIDRNAAQRLTVSTNASNGYQVFAYERQPLTAGSGATIAGVTGTNAAPVGWSSGCSPAAPSCFGYHAGDNTLAGGSTRFLVSDTYAALTDTPAEVAYSGGPVPTESTDIVYRIRVNAAQTAGLYESKLVYIVVPVF